jgi:hypothetical protein
MGNMQTPESDGFEAKLGCIMDARDVSLTASAWMFDACCPSLTECL